jgi:5-methyltetrahydropteroyltriglutamate--homocysteine methyltransferase
MTPSIAAYQYGTYPRSEDVVAATRGLERGRTSQAEVDAAYTSDREAFIRLQRDAGLDYFSDGLLRWQDIFRPLVEASTGLDARSLVRWFDNNSFFRAPEVTGPLGLSGELPPQLDADEGLPAPRVATLPSPFLFSRAAATGDDRNALMLDLSREILRPLAEALARRGYEVIHLQEPWLAYFGIGEDDWGEFEKALTEIKDSVGSTSVVLHVYFGDAGPYVGRLRGLPVDALGIDLVETDVESLGTGWDIGLLAGCLDGRSSPVESADGTVAFLRRVAESIQPPTLFLSSSCELELLPTEIAARKVLRLGEVSARLKGELA